MTTPNEIENSNYDIFEYQRRKKVLLAKEYNKKLREIHKDCISKKVLVEKKEKLEKGCGKTMLKDLDGCGNIWLCNDCKSKLYLLKELLGENYEK